jgi:predicted urease superfamily metal-dependent hydrolase
MTDLNNLIERLLDRGVCSIHHNSCRNDMVCEEAAASLSALMSERDALMEALEAAEAWIVDGGYLDDRDPYTAESAAAIYAQTRAALAAKGPAEEEGKGSR